MVPSSGKLVTARVVAPEGFRFLLWGVIPAKVAYLFKEVQAGEAVRISQGMRLVRVGKR